MTDTSIRAIVAGATLFTKRRQTYLLQPSLAKLFVTCGRVLEPGSGINFGEDSIEVGFRPIRLMVDGCAKFRQRDGRRIGEATDDGYDRQDGD